jgi:hypothetical protein
MSVGFLLGSPDDAVIWRGPKKNGIIYDEHQCRIYWVTKYNTVTTPIRFFNQGISWQKQTISTCKIQVLS